MRPFCTTARRATSTPSDGTLDGDGGLAQLDDARLDHEVVLTLDASRPSVDAAIELASTPPRATRLRELASWYGRVVERPSTSEPPPLEGLDALADELTTATDQQRLMRLAAARWAVRLAEELVRLRSWGRASSSTAMARLAASHLSQTLRAARHHLAQGPSGRV